MCIIFPKDKKENLAEELQRSYLKELDQKFENVEDLKSKIQLQVKEEDSLDEERRRHLKEKIRSLFNDWRENETAND